jgi:WD40 repeat protein
MHHFFVALKGRHDEAQIHRWSLPDLPTIDDLPKVRAALSPADTSTAASSVDRASGTGISSLQGQVAIFEGDSSTIAMIDNNRTESSVLDNNAPATIRVFNAKTGAAEPERSSSDRHQVLSGATAGGQEILYGNSFGDVMLLNVKTGANRRVDRFNGLPDVTAVALTADGRTGAAGTSEGRLHIFSVLESTPAPTVLRDIELDNSISALAFSSDGVHILVAHGRDAEVRDVADPNRQLGSSVELASDIALAAIDGHIRYAAAGMGDGDVVLWDVASGAVLGHWSVGSRPVWIGIAQNRLTVLTSGGKLATWQIHDPEESEARVRQLSLQPLTAEERGRLQLP